MKRMIRFRRMLNQTCLVTVSCIFFAGGCNLAELGPLGGVKATQTSKAYEGPELPREQVAIVKIEHQERGINISRVDGKFVKDSKGKRLRFGIQPHGRCLGSAFSSVAVKPGEHVFLLNYYGGTHYGQAALKANLKAGHTYSAKYKITYFTTKTLIGPYEKPTFFRVWLEDTATKERLGEGIDEKGAEELAVSIDYYEKILESNPNSYEAHRMLGASYGIQKDYAKAKLHLQQSLKINPNQDEQHVSLMKNMISVIETIETVQVETDSSQAMLNMLEPFVDTVFKGSKTLLMSEREEN